MDEILEVIVKVEREEDEEIEVDVEGVSDEDLEGTGGDLEETGDKVGGEEEVTSDKDGGNLEEDLEGTSEKVGGDVEVISEKDGGDSDVIILEELPIPKNPAAGGAKRRKKFGGFGPRKKRPRKKKKKEGGDLGGDDGGEVVEEKEDPDKLFVVEDLLDRWVREGDGALFYLVKWQGYPESKNTWEPIQGLAMCSDLIKKVDERLGPIKSKSKSPPTPPVKQKGRGRPRKSKESQQNLQNSKEESPPEEKKKERRGRPKKNEAISPKNQPSKVTKDKEEDEDDDDESDEESDDFDPRVLDLITYGPQYRHRWDNLPPPQCILGSASFKTRTFFLVKLTPPPGGESQVEDPYDNLTDSNCVIIESAHFSKRFPEMVLNYYQSNLRFVEDTRSPEDLTLSCVQSTIYQNFRQGKVRINGNPIFNDILGDPQSHTGNVPHYLDCGLKKRWWVEMEEDTTDAFGLPEDYEEELEEELMQESDSSSEDDEEEDRKKFMEVIIKTRKITL